MSLVWLGLFLFLFLLANVVALVVVLLSLEHADDLARWCVRLAVQCLPKTHRSRYEREWMAELKVIRDRPLSMLLAALQMLLGALRTGWALRERPLLAEIMVERAKRTIGFVGQVVRHREVTHQLEGDLGLGLALFGIWVGIVGLSGLPPEGKLRLLLPGVPLSVLLIALYRWWMAQQPPKKKVPAT